MNPDVYRDMAMIQEEHWWFAARREILAAVIERLPLPDRNVARILEIGCGTGGNLQMLGRFGQVRAVEGNNFARAHAKRLSGVEVRTGALPGPLLYPARAFDLVCLFDVLEHVARDGAGLAAAAGMLQPNGRLLVTVPAYNWLFGAHDRSHRHFRRYSAHRLARLAASAGLTVERIGYFNTLLFPLIAAHRLLDHCLSRDNASDAVLPSPLFNRLLYTVFAAEAPLVARTFLPFGTSVIAVLSPGRDA